MNTYDRFLNDFFLNEDKLRRAIKIRQNRLRYVITTDRISNLLEGYRPQLDEFEKPYITFCYKDQDLSTWMVILRYHFKLWVEISSESNLLHVYKRFPESFLVTKEVNKQNHRHVQEMIQKDTILYPAEDTYGVVDWLNGIPLSEYSESGKDAPYTQINYDYLKAQHHN